MSIKIFHIADLHLGRSFRNLPEAQDTLSEAHYKTLQKTVSKANELDAEISVIASDLFDKYGRYSKSGAVCYPVCGSI